MFGVKENEKAVHLGKNSLKYRVLSSYSIHEISFILFPRLSVKKYLAAFLAINYLPTPRHGVGLAIQTPWF